METVLSGLRKVSVREEISAAQRKKKREKKNITFTFQCETRRNSKGGGKGGTEEKGPVVPVRHECQTSRYAGIMERDSAENKPNVISGTHQNAHTTNPKSGCT